MRLHEYLAASFASRKFSVSDGRNPICCTLCQTLEEHKSCQHFLQTDGKQFCFYSTWELEFLASGAPTSGISTNNRALTKKFKPFIGLTSAGECFAKQTTTSKLFANKSNCGGEMTQNLQNGIMLTDITACSMQNNDTKNTHKHSQKVQQ